MSLTPGTKLGSYKILEPIGAGCEVYRAKDLKLEREVAIKVLREELASDPERLWYGIEFHRDVNLEVLRDYAPFQELMRPSREAPSF